MRCFACNIEEVDFSLDDEFCRTCYFEYLRACEPPADDDSNYTARGDEDSEC